MIYEPEHPDITLSDWDTFLTQLSPFRIDRVIDRDESDLPEWYVPLARGVAIASNYLLQQVGWPGSYPSKDWYRLSPYVFKLPGSPYRLYSRECAGLWTVERTGPTCREAHSDEVLVHRVGSTPVFTREYQSAILLAEHSHVNAPPYELRWIKACPIDHEGAIALARKRRLDEALARQNAHPAQNQRRARGSRRRSTWLVPGTPIPRSGRPRKVKGRPT
jgi:hypothetical protein